MSATRRKCKSSIDDKVEAKRKIVRQSLDQIKDEIEHALHDANLNSPINIVVPSRYSLVTIGGTRNLPPDEWSRMSAIVCEVIGQKLGRQGLRGRPLARATATARLSAADVTPD
jgi:hypothetical protein